MLYHTISIIVELHNCSSDTGPIV